MKQHKENGIDRIRAGILSLIETERLRFGDRLPTEEKLTTLFGVSRPTLREALKLLEQDGVIDVIHGKGRFVAAGAALSIERPITTFESTSATVHSHGYEATTEVLGFTTIAANGAIAEDLQIAEGDPVFRLERLRRTGKEPLIYSIAWLPRKLLSHAPDLWRLSGSLVEVLGEANHQPVASTATVTAVSLPDDVIGRYGLQRFGPALFIREICFSDHGDRVLLAENYHRGEFFTFSFLRR